MRKVKSRDRKKIRFKYILCILFILAGMTLLAALHVRYSHEDTMTRVDNELRNAVMAIPSLLPRNFHDRATGPRSIPAGEDMRNIRRLSMFEKNTTVDFLYTIVMYQGRFYYTSCSATDDELKNGDNVTYWYSLEQAGDEGIEELKRCFHDWKPCYSIGSDRWGTYRSYIVPAISPGGRKFLMGADYRMERLKAARRRDVVYTMLSYLFVLLLISPLGIISLKSINFQRKELERIAYVDELTGLLNRRAMTSLLRQIYEISLRTGTFMSLSYIDLDGLKTVNDTHGHHAGDMLIRTFARELHRGIRRADMVGRMGGDEFMVILPGTDRNGCLNIMKKLSEHMATGIDGARVCFSYGIASLDPSNPVPLEKLISRADRAMYGNKRRRKQAAKKNVTRGRTAESGVGLDGSMVYVERGSAVSESAYPMLLSDKGWKDGSPAG